MQALQLRPPETGKATDLGDIDSGRRADPPIDQRVLKGRLLGPGDWAVEQAPGLLGSLVESGVCITLWSATDRVGAMCHFESPARAEAPLRLPCMKQETPSAVDCETERVRSGCHCDGRYGDEAFALMCKALLDRGVDPQLCEAKIFGGSRTSGHAIGKLGDTAQRNVARAFALVSEHGMRLGGFHVGRQGGRRIWFNVASGLVDLRLESTEAGCEAGR